MTGWNFRRPLKWRVPSNPALIGNDARASTLVSVISVT